jgi:hypothetical protein
MIDEFNLFDKVKFYIVQNDKGEFYRFGGKPSWTTDPTKCRIYNKIGPARVVVTFFSTRFPQYPILKILELSVGDVKILDESNRITKNKEAKAIKIAENERIKAFNQLCEAERNFNKISKKG